MPLFALPFPGRLRPFRGTVCAPGAQCTGQPAGAGPSTGPATGSTTGSAVDRTAAEGVPLLVTAT
ncbi:hypothetical protein, partial [Streptomyces clavuligerus]